MGFIRSDQPEGWLGKVLEDKKLLKHWRPSLKKYRDTEYFRGNGRNPNAPPGVFWFELVQLKISKKRLTKLQDNFVEAGMWPILALEMWDTYREAEARIFQEVTLVEELNVMELVGEGKADGDFPDDYTPADFVDEFMDGDLDAVADSGWGLENTFQVIRYVEKALTKALQVKSDLENPYNTKY